MRFLRNRSVRHRAGREPFHDRLDRLDLCNRDRVLAVVNFEQTAQRRKLAALIVDQLRVLLEDRVLAGARRVLQLEHRVGIEEVILAVATPLVFATGIQLVDTGRLTSERALVTETRFLRDDVDADAADA